MMCMATVAEGDAALQTAKHLMPTAEGSLLAESPEDSPLQPLEADGGLESSRMSAHEESSKPAANSAEAESAAAAGTEPQEEGQNTPEARLLYLQQGIDRLVSCRTRKERCVHLQVGNAISEPRASMSCGPETCKAAQYQHGGCTS